MYTTLGILAHVDAGKTTLSEQMLYRTGVLRTLGRVDQKNAFLDHEAIERERGITVFSDQAIFKMGRRTFQLVDTPGHADFSGEMERCLQILDCAILMISCIEGIQSHTETIWKLLRERKIPTFLFLNKTDRPGADPKHILETIVQKWKAPILNFTENFGEEGTFSPILQEGLAGLNDQLLEQYLSDQYDPAFWLNTTRRLTAECKMFPALYGAALNGEGVESLLSLLSLLAPIYHGNSQAPLEALAYKVRHDRNGGRVVFLKILNGTLFPKASVDYLSKSSILTEKVDELRCYHAGKFSPVKVAEPGMLCGVTGLSSLKPGERIGGELTSLPSIQPLLSSRVLFDSSIPARTILGYFKILEDEEPLLGIEWNEELQEIKIHVMGPIQLEVLAHQFEKRFGQQISFGPCQILYRETISKPVNGCGHFEPLRHYAEVHLRLEPGRRGSGITFQSICSTDDLSENWQNLIRTHVFEKEHRGVLTGSPLTDVQITLTAGRAHLKHTEGGDFREATYRAIRQGLMKADNILLEPFLAFDIQANPSLTGRILSDLQRLNAFCNSPELSEDTVVIRGRAPAVNLMDYPQDFSVLTKGSGIITLRFDGYEPCHNTEEVINKRKYDPERDLENSPDSIFCSHGAGYPVKWNDVESHMHIKLK